MNLSDLLAIADQKHRHAFFETYVNVTTIFVACFPHKDCPREPLIPKTCVRRFVITNVIDVNSKHVDQSAATWIRKLMLPTCIT